MFLFVFPKARSGIVQLINSRRAVRTVICVFLSSWAGDSSHETDLLLRAGPISPDRPGLARFSRLIPCHPVVSTFGPFGLAERRNQAAIAMKSKKRPRKRNLWSINQRLLRMVPRWRKLLLRRRRRRRDGYGNKRFILFLDQTILKLVCLSSGVYLSLQQVCSPFLIEQFDRNQRKRATICKCWRIGKQFSCLARVILSCLAFHGLVQTFARLLVCNQTARISRFARLPRSKVIEY